MEVVGKSVYSSLTSFHLVLCGGISLAKVAQNTSSVIRILRCGQESEQFLQTICAWRERFKSAAVAQVFPNYIFASMKN